MCIRNRLEIHFDKVVGSNNGLVRVVSVSRRGDTDSS